MKKWCFLFILFFLVGCDFKEIRNLSIVSTMGIDFIDDTYQVSIIVVDKKEGESKFYSGEGDSFFKAVQAVHDKLTETLYLGHLQNVIVSEAVSKEGLAPITSYFVKEDVIQNNFYLFLIRNSTSNEVLHYLMENSGYTLSNIFKNNTMVSLKKDSSSIHSFLQNLYQKGKDPILHSLSFDKGALSSPSLALFRKDKVVGFTDIAGYYLLSGNAEQVYISLPCGDKETTFSIHHIQTHTSLNKNHIRHSIYGNVSVKENNCNRSVRSKTDQRQIQKDIQKVMTEKINLFLEDQKKEKVHAFSYSSFLSSDNYDSVDIHIHLRDNDLTDKEGLHE